jgi:hypothetical protein
MARQIVVFVRWLRSGLIMGVILEEGKQAILEGAILWVA